MVRLGRISYVNMAPVFHRLNAEVEEVQGVPTELNAMLLDGQLDLAPISSIEYARHAQSLRILPRMCVSSEGAVDSIQLVSGTPFSLDPLDRGDARERDVGRAREGAAAATRSTCRSARRRDAKLLIGDAALRSAFEDPTPHYDLGKLWLEQHRPADGLRRLGGAGAGRGRRRRARARARRLGAARALRARACSPTRRASATAIRPATSRATSRSCATRSARASGPASTRSSSWRATSASSSTCPSCASSSARPRPPV